MPSLMTVAAPMVAFGALLAPNCGGCGPANNLGMVWEDEQFPAHVNQPAGSQPRFEYGDAADPTVVRLNMLLYLDPAATGSLSAACAQWIAFTANQLGQPPENECLYIEWEIDVGGSAPIMMFDGPLTRPDGRVVQGEDGSGELAPGTDENYFGVYLPGGQPGSTLQWQITAADGAPLYDGTYLIPAADQFQYIGWNYF